MPKNFTYANSGVNRKQRAESKKALKTLQQTYKLSYCGAIMHLPYGKIFPLNKNTYLDLVIEGVGTKVLIAQLAKEFNSIGIDAVAMAVNDVIRSGAKPIAISDNIHAQTSNPRLVQEWLDGIAKGANEANCPVVSGEIGDVAEVIKGIEEGKGFDMVVAAVGQVAASDIITGRSIQADDSIIGLRSSGIHSNGISLARRILFKEWGGRYEPHEIPEGMNKEIVLEALEPTRIYVEPLLKVNKRIEVKAAVHITGDAYLKFNNLTHFSNGIGFEFNNFKPQSIFNLIQETAKELNLTIADEEMFKTFNMGWGFAIIVDKKEAEDTLEVLEKEEVEAEVMGRVTGTGGITISYRNKKIFLA